MCQFLLLVAVPFFSHPPSPCALCGELSRERTDELQGQPVNSLLITRIRLDPVSGSVFVRSSVTRVGSVPEDLGLSLVGHEVVDVRHLVVRRDQVLHRHVSAHLDPVSNRVKDYVKSVAKKLNLRSAIKKC